jgi:hypothetical protein
VTAPSVTFQRGIIVLTSTVNKQLRKAETKAGQGRTIVGKISFLTRVDVVVRGTTKKKMARKGSHRRGQLTEDMKVNKSLEALGGTILLYCLALRRSTRPPVSAAQPSSPSPIVATRYGGTSAASPYETCADGPIPSIASGFFWVECSRLVAPMTGRPRYSPVKRKSYTRGVPGWVGGP